MIRKIGITIVTTLLAVFGLGHVRALVTHGQFGCAAAAAQQGWADGGSGDSEPDEVSTEPEIRKTPPNVAGNYSGLVKDHKLGTGTIEMTIDQHPNWKLSGTWGSVFGGSTFTGSINYVAGDWVLKFLLKIKGSCHLKATGMLVAPDEIAGPYEVENCKGYKGDFGTFDITD